MSPVKKRATALIIVAAIVVSVATALSTLAAAGANPARAPAQDREKSVELTRRAAELIQEGRPSEAFALLEQAVAADDTYWEAYYQQGRLFGMQEDFLMARHVLLKASELNPGHPHTHRLAFEATYRIGDYENAWDQAIRATLAGVDMNPWFLEMYAKSDAPEDFEQRINAPKIYVAAIDTGNIEAANQLPFNRNPAAGGGTLSGRPAYAEGVNRANEHAFDLERMRRNMRDAVSRAPYLGTVLDLQLADYILGISVDALGAAEPVSMVGYLRLYDTTTGEAVYFKSLYLRDISSESYLFGEMQRQIIELQAWTLQQRR